MQILTDIVKRLIMLFLVSFQRVGDKLERLEAIDWLDLMRHSELGVG